MIEQRDLFKERKKEQTKLTVESKAPHFSLPTALDLINECQQEAIMWLRMSAYQGVRTRNEQQFIKAIQGEVDLKKGRKPAHFCVQEALLTKTFT